MLVWNRILTEVPASFHHASKSVFLSGFRIPFSNFQPQSRHLGLQASVSRQSRARQSFAEPNFLLLSALEMGLKTHGFSPRRTRSKVTQVVALNPDHLNFQTCIWQLHGRLLAEIQLACCLWHYAIARQGMVDQ